MMVAVNETLRHILFAMFVRFLSLSLLLSFLMVPFPPSFSRISMIFKRTVDVIKFITIANIYCGTQ
jgi:hypothetical protein